MRKIWWVAILVLSGMVPSLRADEGPTDPPSYGVYYDRREPSFYTGFAPRTSDPRRLHLHIGRGNQLRVTAVLADDVLIEYARDLWQRWRTYRALIDSRRLVLTQNNAFDEFEQRLREVELERLVREEKALAPATLRERNLRLLERLNPGRVFRIRMPVDDVVQHWSANVRPADHRGLDGTRRLELVNLLLPTRLWVTELEPGVGGDVDALVARVPATPGAKPPPDLRAAYLALLARLSKGLYPVRDGEIAFDEFTAIYPVGTFNEYTTWNGKRIPDYPTPGRRTLTTHQRSLTVDHIPTDESYSYSPWLPYMHVGTNMHNSFHTLWWQMERAHTGFLPAAWRGGDHDDRDGKPYRYLWLLSRGPMSHGCTHVNAGHIAELRQLLPAETERLYDVNVFYNQSQLYDVFDIDGDLTPEVMGVRYFIAYSLRDKTPDQLRAPLERRAYYAWLYAGDLDYDAADHGVFHDVRDGRFVGRDAVIGRQYESLALREAAYEPERVQFYRLVDIPFVRELRKVSVEHPFPGLALATGGAGAVSQ
ncbi:MAG TPA: hypothetical protein VLI07_06770 [Candidatus Binatus sp.]|jgi:hypothetical protein|nr:hypothetical protein [Candidatus Binatus sp.]